MAISQALFGFLPAWTISNRRFGLSGRLADLQVVIGKRIFDRLDKRGRGRDRPASPTPLIPSGLSGDGV